MNKNIDDELSRWIVQLLIKEPFYAHFLGQVTRIISEDITDTAAVGIRNNAICLFINPKFFLEKLKTWTEEIKNYDGKKKKVLRCERVAIVKHEVLHLVFKHLYRHKKNWHPYIANLAADLVVNQYIAPWPLPKGAILLEQFSVLNLKPEETLEYYYSKLIEAKQCAGQKISEIEQKIESDNEKNNGKSNKELEDWKKIDDLLNENDSCQQEIWMDDHEKWSDKVADEAEMHRIDDAILTSRNRMKEKDWHDPAKTPNFIKQIVDAILEKRKPQVDWKRSLRIFANSSRHSKVIGTMKRYSRRFGEPSTGVRIKSFQKIAVIIDTSGSVDDHSLSLFFTEIHAMWRKRAEIFVIECDDSVGRTYAYMGKFPKGVSGRGGTQFDPAFQFLQNVTRKQRFDGCIYLTDGYAHTPQIKPPCKLLWVLTPDGTDEHLAFGSNVKLN